MTSYVESTLISDEHVVYAASVSLWCLTPLFLLGLILLPVFGIGLFFLARAAIIYWTTELAVTNKRVIAKTGLIQRDTIEMFLSKVESVHVEQTVMGRMFNFGTVVISGTGAQNAAFRRISHPLEFRREFMTAADASAAQARAPGRAIQETAENFGSRPIPGTAADLQRHSVKPPLEERLAELKRLYDGGLISEDIYKEQQRKAIEG